MTIQPPYRADNLTQHPLELYLEKFRASDPREISVRTGVPCMENAFILTVLGETKTITWPDFADENWRDKDRILFVRYLLEGRKTDSYSGFTTYRLLPWGDVYDRQFTARCVNRLAGTYGTRAQIFASCAEKLGAKKVQSSGLAYEFPFMPGLAVQMILWEGDEDFPASAQILFSDNFPEAFSAEDRVVVCEYILGKLRMME